MLSWIRGFKSPFSLLEFKKRIENFSVDNEKVKRLNTLLEDIYRVGIIGNYNPYLKSHRWQHKSDERVIIDEGWLFVIHNGLNTALSVTKAKKEKNQTDLYNYDSTALKPNEIYDAVVTRIYPNRVIVDIHDNGMKYKGSIHISKVTNRFVRDINEYFNIGKQVTVKVLNYDSLHRSWVLENQTLITN
ncbi:hypothetical protein DRW41_00625 [Neobacillus piezotolerans]|uniref:S1 motif domain-containing protein n=2 Tax=Neobacillus piezotolerans TaxID=2259171 RepID=A0A3D8GWX1_9BACI|nr:hypothetical protein DRW41_00625 [Neobacillus piezotolerans]